MSSTDTTTGQDFSRGKIDCPDCGTSIELDFRELFAGGSATCPNCRAELSIDIEQSRSTIDAIKEAQQAMSAATNGEIKPLE